MRRAHTADESTSMPFNWMNCCHRRTSGGAGIASLLMYRRAGQRSAVSNLSERRNRGSREFPRPPRPDKIRLIRSACCGIDIGAGTAEQDDASQDVSKEDGLQHLPRQKRIRLSEAVGGSPPHRVVGVEY